MAAGVTLLIKGTYLCLSEDFNKYRRKLCEIEKCVCVCVWGGGGGGGGGGGAVEVNDK